MMPYSTIQPPFTLKFLEMSREELNGYGEWFFSVMPERTAILESVVRESVPSWKADLSPDSLAVLGEWFETQVETRLRTAEERNKILADSPYPIEVAGEDLTTRTFSLTMDIGMYWGQITVARLSGTRWEQKMNGMRDINFGQPVVVGTGKVPMNPVRLCVTLAYGIPKKMRRGGELRQLYDIWAENLVPKA
jgi:hypothetical protein